MRERGRELAMIDDLGKKANETKATERGVALKMRNFLKKED